MFDRIGSFIFAILFLALGCACVVCIFGALAEGKNGAGAIAAILFQIAVCVCVMAYYQARSAFYPEK